MTISWMYCCLLELIVVFNTSEGSIPRRFQYYNKSTDSDARVIATCVKLATRALFEPSNRIVVIASENFKINDSSLMDTILTRLSSDMNAVTVGSDFVFHRESLKAHRYSTNRDSSYLIMDNSSEKLNQIFLNNALPIWAEYLVVTRINIDTLESFAAFLRQRGFLRFAFLHTKREISKTSTLYNRNMKILTTFENHNGSLRIKNFTERVREFSRFLCPAKGCYMTVGQVKTDMVGSSAVAESRKVLDPGDRIVRFSVSKMSLKLNNCTLNNWTEALDVIEREKIDVTYGSFIPRAESLELLDVATWFTFEKIMFFDMVNIIYFAPLTKIFNPLDTYVWLCIILCLTVYSVFAFMILKAYERKMINETIEIFDIWAILLGQGVRNPYNTGLRGILGMWMITALLINASYGSAFKSSLAQRTRLTPLKNIDDINNSGRGIVGAEVAGQLFQNSDDQRDRLIYKKWRRVPTEKVFSEAIKEYDVGIDYDINVKVHNLMERNLRRSRLYTIKEPILVYPVNFYLKKRHPYLKAFRRIVTWTNAAGLIQKWYRDDFENMLHRSNPFRRFFKWNRVSGLRHWKVSFKIWSVGNSIAGFSFFYELYKFRKDCSKKMTKTNSTAEPMNDSKIAEDFRKIWNIVERVKNKNTTTNPTINLLTIERESSTSQFGASLNY